MSRRLGKVAVVFVIVLGVLFTAAQLVRPARTNPPTVTNHTFQASCGASGDLVAIVERSCGDCHSNATVWARYTTTAPLSWLIVRGVNEGRHALNFSEWGAYPPAKRRALLEASCKDARKGTMPVQIYLRFRPEARLSASDVETICAASSQGETNTATTQ
jgi:hypothetical protein